MSASNQSLKQDILHNELQVWTALVTGDARGDAAALADDFLGIYSDGFAGKADHVGQLATGPTVQQFDLTETRFRALGQNHCVLSYRADFLRHGQTMPETMFVTSIWERHDNKWLNILSQDTPQVTA